MSHYLRSDEKKKAQASIIKDDELRIVLVGKTGSGKSATGNTILAYEAFVAERSFVSVTSSCKEARRVVGFREVSVVDTPGLFDTLRSEVDTLKEISDCIRLAAPGPHAFLIVIRVDRFTVEEQRSVEMIQRIFGEESNEYTMVLFTHGDGLEGKRVEDILKKCPKLQELVATCSGRYHVFNIKALGSPQVNELLVKINQMVSNNGGSHYTNEMFQEAARKEKERKLGEKSRAEREEMIKVCTNSGKAAVAGGCIAAAVEASVLGAASGVLASPIGLAVGGAVGFAIGGGILLYKRLNR